MHFAKTKFNVAHTKLICTLDNVVVNNPRVILILRKIQILWIDLAEVSAISTKAGSVSVF